MSTIAPIAHSLESFQAQHDRLNRQGFPNSYVDESGDWLIVLGQHRDSDILEQSNFETARKRLEAIDPDCYRVESESHWAVGWVETLLVDPANPQAIECAEAIREAIEDYPILDETDYSERTYDCYLESWNEYGRQDTLNQLGRLFASHCACTATIDGWIADYLDDIDGETADGWRDIAVDYVNEEYHSESSGVFINCQGIAEEIFNHCDILPGFVEWYLANSQQTASEQRQLLAELYSELGEPLEFDPISGMPTFLLD